MSESVIMLSNYLVKDLCPLVSGAYRAAAMLNSKMPAIADISFKQLILEQSLLNDHVPVFDELLHVPIGYNEPTP